MAAVLLCATLLAVAPSDAWPQFRGTGDSVSQATNLPLSWSDNENVAWRTDLAGFGQSSPVIWKGKVFVTSVQGEFKDALIIECLDLKTGKQLWRQDFQGTQKIKDGGYVSKSAPTPAVDGDRVYALFESGNLVAVDHAGKAVWQRSLVDEYGKIGGAHGLGTSVVLADGKVVVLIDNDGPSYLLACDPATGKNVWKTDRPAGMSWSTPTIVQDGNQTLLIVSAHDGVQAYDAATGKEIWSFTGLNGNNVPSPTLAADKVVIGSDKTGSNVAVRLGGAGDVTSTHLAWSNDKVSATFGSPLVVGEAAYFVNRAGVCFCVDVATGQTLWNERIPSSCWASSVAAEGRVYLFSKDGSTTVIAAGKSFQKLSENRISLEGDDRVYGVAFLDGAILVRTYRQLVRFGLP